MKTLIIDRARWLNADTVDLDVEDSCLYDTGTRKMCCLGFAARQLAGARVNDIAEVYSPAGCSELKWPKYLAPICTAASPTGKNALMTDRLMNLNDTDAIKTPKVREKRITKKFADIGIRVKYIGKYPKKVSK